MRDNKDLSAQESLQVITAMIEATKSSIGDKSHFFLLWGWTTLIGCLLQYYLLVIAKYEHHYFAWFVTPVAILLHAIFLYKYRGEVRIKTFIGEANRYVWTVIGLSYLVLGVIFTKMGWQYSFPFYILLYGIGTYISGSLMKFTPMRYGAIACLPLAAIVPFVDYPVQILLAGFSILISYIIPGHLLRIRYQRGTRNKQ